MKRHSFILILVFVFLKGNSFAGIVEYSENVYLKPAPKNIVNIVEKTAKLVDFNGNYEIMIPKKPYVQINPWTKFMAYAKNPLTKNFMIIINDGWFLNIPEEQQIFLLGRVFVNFKRDVSSFFVKSYPFIWLLFLVLFVYLLFWVLGKTWLVNYKKWIRFIVTIVIIRLSSFLFIDDLYSKGLSYLVFIYDLKVNERALEKTKDKIAAIGALEYFNSSINSEFKKGDKFFACSLTLFKDYADSLKNI